MSPPETSLESSCVCGNRIKHGPDEIGRNQMCPACGRLVTLTADSTPPGSVLEIKCPHCHELVHKIWGPCPRCGRNVGVTADRMVFFVIAGLIAAALLYMGAAGMMRKSRKFHLDRATRNYHSAFMHGLWKDIYELTADGPRNTFGAFRELMEEEYRNVVFKDFSSEKTVMNEDKNSAGVDVRVEVLLRKTGKRASFNVREKWIYRDGKWLNTYSDEIIENIREALADSGRQSMKTIVCPLCGGEGTVTCARCGGDGLLDDGAFCPECFKSQGWQVCPTCRGAGEIFEK